MFAPHSCLTGVTACVSEEFASQFASLFTYLLSSFSHSSGSVKKTGTLSILFTIL